MEQAGSSGLNSMGTKEMNQEKLDESGSRKSNVNFYSPQDLVEVKGVAKKPIPFDARCRGRPVKSRMDALTVSISNSIDYESIQFPVACDICCVVFGNGTILMNHMKQDHADFIPFQCRVCNKPFAKMAQLQKHTLSHGGDKQFECPICNQRFSRADSAKVHMRIHDKSKCVHCDVCEKSFLTQGALNIHQRIHRGEKPFKCHLCGKCFTQKNHVIMHIMRHSRVNNPENVKTTTPRMFQCEVCPRSFIRLSDFQRHMQWTHGRVATNTIAEPAKMQICNMAPLSNKPVKIKAFYEKLSMSQNTQKKTLCTTATQTDDNVGRIIIPRQYQNQGSATPRHEEDLYDNEMFDDGGMDRNYSSDEDDMATVEPFMGMTNFGTSMSAVDEAFDAVLGKPGNSSTSDEKTQSGSSKSFSQDDSEVNPLKEEVAPDDNLEEAPTQADACQSEISTVSEDTETTPGRDTNIEQTSVEDVEKVNDLEGVTEKDASLISIYNRNSEDVILSRTVPKINSNFDMSNWLCRSERGRGRARGKNKMIMGLRGAAHLRLMRKSLMTFISERGEPDYNDDALDDAEDDMEEGEVVKAEVKVTSGKRLSKAKKHGKDFMCSSKTCELCQPSIIKPASTQTKVVRKIKKELPIGQCLEKSQKLLQFICGGDVNALEGTDFQLLSQVADEHENIYQGYKMEPQFEDSENNLNNEDDVEGVEFDSVCIPTYSCKLCGREFRFEGKLHRHIESVHQKKILYSPDVRPGSKRIKLEEQEYYSEPVKKKLTSVTPDIAALWSDWDDEGDDNLTEKTPIRVSQPAKFAKPVQRRWSNIPIQRFAGGNIDNRRYQREYTNNTYPQGVKLNFNKFPGIKFNERRAPVKIRAEQPKPPIPKSVSLETKCSQLLEKLFKMNLLAKCGHLVDHVSTVLGRVLLHYGVKMIEDYGQGQYEVLKYNLWRLIEWKVTMEQMEEFYTQGKSVEEMMDDIMNSRVPITAHTEPSEKKASEIPVSVPLPVTISAPAVDSMPINDQLVISQVALDGNVTQLVLAQDVSPEMLQGARIVTLDPVTGQVISQVTADQVIIAGSVSEELTRQIESIDSQIVVSNSSSSTTILSALPPGSIVSEDGTIHINTTTIEGELIESDDVKSQNLDDTNK